MTHVTEEALKWALETISGWAQGVSPRGRRNLPRFFVLKALDVTICDPKSAQPYGTSDFDEVTSKLFQVSFTSQPSTIQKTGGKEKHLNPFAASYPKVDDGAKWAVGTLWTRCGTWREHGILVWEQTVDSKRKFSFGDQYIELILDSISQKKIPALAAATFFFRRPSQSGLNINGCNTNEDLLARFAEELHITEDEKAGLFNWTVPADAPNVLGSPSELAVEEALDTCLLAFPHREVESVEQAAAEDEAASEKPAGEEEPASTKITWKYVDADEDPCDLVGLSKAYNQAVAALESGKHLILLGPPGTGKSALAQCIAVNLVADEWRMSTATSEWSTFETIGGYMPTVSSSANSASLEFSPGLIFDAIKRNHWLIIDELNRADMDRAFGELFTVFSNQTVTLPFTIENAEQRQRIQLLPPSAAENPHMHCVRLNAEWRMIGTMNTFDKSSLYQMSYAFMRRFAFVNIPIPHSSSYEGVIRSSAGDPLTKDETFSTTVLEPLIKLFCCQTEPNLASVDLQVGPAIAKDVIRYVRLRSNTTEALRTAILEALQMYLFPQFEGKDREHAVLLDAIAASLSLGAEERAWCSDQMKLWTAYEGDA